MMSSGTNVLKAARLHVSSPKGDGLNCHNSAAQNEQAARIDESETIRVNAMQATNTPNATAVESGVEGGATASTTPRAVATPLPPRNFSQQGNMWPRMAAVPLTTAKCRRRLAESDKSQGKP